MTNVEEKEFTVGGSRLCKGSRTGGIKRIERIKDRRYQEDRKGQGQEVSRG
jgi:hypothetical protein